MKLQRVLIGIVAIAVTLTAVFPILTLAASVPSTDNFENANCGSTFGISLCDLFKFLNWIIDSLAGLVLAAVENLFDFTIQQNQGSEILKIPAIYAAWGIARDTANLFFIVVLIISAVATIFDLTTFHIKSVLPRLILVALLINFSITIGIFVIDQANGLGNFFYSGLTGGGKSIAAVIHTNLIERAKGAEEELRGSPRTNNSGTLPIPANATDAETLRVAEENTEFPPISQLSEAELAASGMTPAQIVRTRLQHIYRASECGSKADPASGGDQEALKTYYSPGCTQWRNRVTTRYRESLAEKDVTKMLAIRFVARIFIYPVVIFVLAAGAFLLISRIASLIFILILAPLAFLSHLVPGQDRYWGEWWNSLFKQSFFFPAFTFCLMIATMVMNTTGKYLASDVASSVRLLTSYFISVALFVGALIVSQKLSISGANTAMGIGKRWTGNVRNFAQTKAKNAALRTAGAISQGALNTRVGAYIGRTPILNQAFERAAIKREALRDEREKKRIKRQQEISSIKGIEQYNAARFETIGSARTRQDDQDAFLKAANRRQLSNIIKGMTGAQVYEIYTRQKDEKVKANIIGATDGFDKKVTAQTGKEKPPKIGTRPPTDGTIATQQAQAEYDDQIEQIKKQQLEWTRAVKQTYGSMPAEQKRAITPDEMKDDYVKETILTDSPNKGSIRHTVNTEAKADVFSHAVLGAAGLTEDYIERSLKNGRKELEILKDIAAGLEKRGGEDDKEHLVDLAKKVRFDGSYQQAILNYVPMSGKFTEQTQRAEGREEEGEGETRQSAGGGGART